MFLQNPRNELPDHFLAFANPTRLRILERLATAGEVNVNELAALSMDGYSMATGGILVQVPAEEAEAAKALLAATDNPAE